MEASLLLAFVIITARELTSLEINGLPSYYMRKRRIMNKRKNRRWECNLAQTRSVKTEVEEVVTFLKLSAIKQ